MESPLTLTPLAIDIGLHWLAVTFYVMATIANVSGLIFLRPNHESRSYQLIITGLVIHAVALVYRWVLSGHGPYLAKYEVLSSCAWVSLVLFLVYRRFYPWLRQGSIVVFPASFLMIAIGLFTNPALKKLPPTFTSIWLVFHIGFYKIALATLLIALAFSIFYILQQRASYSWLSKLPAPDLTDIIAYRFAGFGFIFWAIAMLAGSIWAYQSWGRFWGWDPIETWSLITWIFFGVYLHLRRFFAWYGERAACLLIVCFALSIVALFFAGSFTGSIHAAYFQ